MSWTTVALVVAICGVLEVLALYLELRKRIKQLEQQIAALSQAVDDALAEVQKEAASREAIRTRPGMRSVWDK